MEWAEREKAGVSRLQLGGGICGLCTVWFVLVASGLFLGIKVYAMRMHIYIYMYICTYIYIHT